MKRTYYLAIAAAVLVAIVIFSVLNYSSLLVLYAQYSNSHNINVFFVTRNGKLIQNVSVSLFAFYPTPNGTVIKEIYHGHNLKYLSIPVSNLTGYAKHWLNTYNYTVLIPNGTHVIKKHIKYNASLIIPSLVGFASYYVVNQSNGTITIYTQSFSVSVSPQNITHGIGKNVFKAFASPIVKKVKVKESSSSSSSNVASPQQTTTTLTTTVPQCVGCEPLSCVWYELNNYWVYPNNGSGLGPIPLAVAYVTDYYDYDYTGTLTLSEAVSNTNGAKISFGITVLGVPIQISGNSITLSGNYYSTYLGLTLGNGVSNFAEIYTLGQVAFANFTEYEIGCGPYSEIPVGNVAMIFVTAIQAVGENGAYVPDLYGLYSPIGGLSLYFGGTLVNTNQVAQSGSPYYAIFDTSVIETSTSVGYLGGAFPLKPIIIYALDTGEDVPDWVSALIPTPSISVTLFTTNVNYYNAELTLNSRSINTYYLYYEETNITYDIGGNNYYLPMFYFYINYSS